MSEETLNAVEAAIQAHIADEVQGLVVGWVAYASSDTGNAETTTYSTMTSDSPKHVKVGLSQMLAEELRYDRNE